MQYGISKRDIYVSPAHRGAPRQRIKIGQKLSGNWLADGAFYFPMSVNETPVVYVATGEVFEKTQP